MNPDQPSREQIEARITALLLGELPADEAELLRYTIAQDPKLQKLHDELKAALVLVREAEKNVGEHPVEKAAPLKLSAERRQKLLAHFKTQRTKATPGTRAAQEPLFWLKRIRVPTLIETLIVVAIVAMVAALLLPSLATAKRKAQRISPLTEARQRALTAEIQEEDKRNSLANAPGTTPSDATAPPAPATTPAALPAQIVLPQMESTAEVTAQTGAPAEAGKAGVYSQQIVGYVNVPKTADTSVVTVSPAPATAAVPPVATEANGVTLNYSTQDRTKSLEKQWVVPGQALDSAGSTGKPSAGNNQNAGAVGGTIYAYGGAGGGGGGGGGGAGGTVAPPPSTLQPPPTITGSPSSVPAAAPVEAPPALAANGISTEFSRDKELFVAQNPQEGTSTRRQVSGVPTHGAAGLAGNRFYRNPADKAEEPKITTLSGSFRGFYIESENLAPNINPAVPATPPSAQPATAPGSIPPQTPYVVKSGDTLTRIARQNHTTVKALKDINSLNSDRIAAGAKLKLPPATDSFKTGLATTDSEWLGLLDTNSQPQSGSGTAAKPRQGFVSRYAYLPPTGVVSAGLGTNALAMNGGAQRTFTPGTSAISFDDLATLTETAKKEDQVEAQKSLTEKAESDLPLRKPAPNTPLPQPEILTRDNNFSTFSLNVSDVSFKFAEASLQNEKLPDTASIRSEEFINAFDYRDPEAAPGQPMAFAAERARYPFAHNRDLLRFAIKTAAAGRQEGRALNLVLLLDISGSMERSDRVAIIHEALRVLATQLQPQDTVSVVTFSRTARLWADGVRGDKAGETLERVGEITPEGGTNLEEAMRLAYETAHRHYIANGINRVVLLTDGAANLGDVNPADLKQKVEAQRKQGIALDCFGIGWEDFNDDLLEQLSSTGDGRYAFLNSPEDVAKDFAAKLAGALQIAAADVKVQVEFNPQRVISYRQIGYATHQLTKEQFRDNTVAAGQIAAQEAGNALYTIETNPNGEGPIATVHVRYKVPGTDEYREHSWDVAYTGNAPTLEQSSPAMRLAATASAFSEWLAASPYAQEVTLDELLRYLSGVPEIYGADDRPKQLETMIREAKSLEGK